VTVAFGQRQDPRAAYEALADDVVRHAPGAAPVLAGFTACVDSVYRMDTARMEALAAQADRRTVGATVATDILTRIAEHRGGEVFVPWPTGADWARGVLGEPEILQVGGTGPQAAWTLAVLGAPTVIALSDRSSDQLAALHPAIGLCGPTGLSTVGAQRPEGATPSKPRHVICEFTSGIRWSGGTVARSTRIILRFAADGLERDENFAHRAHCGHVGAALMSGVNSLAREDESSREWVADVVRRWRDAGLRLVHHELAEFGSHEELRAATAFSGITSLGMSLSELRMLAGSVGADPVGVAHDLALSLGIHRLCVHADEWSLAVHQDDPEIQRAALATGNLLATARAAEGRPVATPHPHPEATYTTDHPAGHRLGGGWWADCVPAPYLPWPAATVGLGDTFTAGTLLGLLLATAASPRPESERQCSTVDS
jgi:ADP-dependent phosphofructokinase/glucokinase